MDLDLHVPFPDILFLATVQYLLHIHTFRAHREASQFTAFIIPSNLPLYPPRLSSNPLKHIIDLEEVVSVSQVVREWRCTRRTISQVLNSLIANTITILSAQE